jgi:hypothetical protein
MTDKQNIDLMPKNNLIETSKNKGILTPKEQIDVILADYSFREAEANKFTTGLMNIVTISIAFLIGFLAIVFESNLEIFFLVLPFGVMFIIAIECHRRYMFYYISMYKSLLEERINLLAGKGLLQWELKANMGKTYGKGFYIYLHDNDNNEIKRFFSFNFSDIAIIGIPLSAIFILGLLKSGIWFFNNYIVANVWNWLFLCVYYITIFSLLGLIIFTFLYQTLKILPVIEKKLRAELDLT